MASPADTPNEYLIRVLALAHEEFDDAYDSLVADDEPGRKDIRDANPSRVISTLGRVASVASGLVFGKLHPRNPVWANADVDTRIDWWVDRVGTAAAALAAGRRDAVAGRRAGRGRGLFPRARHQMRECGRGQKGLRGGAVRLRRSLCCPAKKGRGEGFPALPANGDNSG